MPPGRRQPMLRRKLFIVLMVGSIGLTGCGGEAARSTQTQTSSAGAGPNKNISQASLATRPARPSRKEFAREASLSTYHNPAEGISFRYPRNYSLEEGGAGEFVFSETAGGFGQRTAGSGVGGEG